MDGTSPGNMPLPFNVWVGQTAWAPNPEAYPLNVAAGAVCAPMNCIIDWPPNPWAPGFVPVAPAQPATHFHFTPAPQISDADVERIAKRAADIIIERLKETK